MKIGTTFAILAVLCCVAWAESDAIDNRQSTIADGPDAVTIPRMLSYQGKLTDNGGVPVPDTTYSVAFRLYTVPSGGTQFWTETQTVRTKSGLFSALLGSVTPIGSMPDAGAVYLGMAVGGGAELAPRLRIASAAYAYLTERAANADLLQGRDTTTFSRSTHSHDATYVNEGQADAVTSAMIVNGTVAAADLNQMGATSGQVMKWTGSAWAPRNDSVGGGGGGGSVTSVSQATGVVCTPNPITTTGTVAFDQSYGDGRYVNTAGDSMTGALAVQGELRVYGKGRIGLGNSNAGSGAFVAGEGNNASATYSSVSGGADNTASGVHSHISGGGENRASGDYSSVGGGIANYASGSKSSVAGGGDNEAYGLYCAIGGGWVNMAGDSITDTAVTVAGGYRNLATGRFAFVGGGKNDTASGYAATVAGGYSNTAESVYASVGGGYNNTAAAGYASVGGGTANVVRGNCATVAGGRNNSSGGSYAAVGGGYSNEAPGYYAAVGGGFEGSASAHYTTVAGGKYNSASDTGAAVGGGGSNQARGQFATIAGGQFNEADSNWAAVGGGNQNLAYGEFATIAGGYTNRAYEDMATVSGGFYNWATGPYSMVPGGWRNHAEGYGSLAGGCNAWAHHAGSFVWGDSTVYYSDSVTTTGANQFKVRARGGTWFYSNAGMTTGAYLAAGSNAWASACDSSTKEDFREVDRRELLQRVAALRVRNYKMRDQDDGTRHIGPVAQDFAAAFGVGENNTSINMADADGVLLAAVQALYEQNQLQQAEIEALKAALTEGK